MGVMSSRDTSESSSSSSEEEVLNTRKRERVEEEEADVIEKNGYCWKFFVGRPCVAAKCYYKHEIPDQADPEYQKLIDLKEKKKQKVCWKFVDGRCPNTAESCWNTHREVTFEERVEWEAKKLEVREYTKEKN